MTEEKVKKRGWVKNVAIIFLSVLLVLTFFSNTFMNRSLPEVAAQYVTSGSIASQIRGSGTVTAMESFEVKTEQTRKVLSVPVKAGDEVKVGDTLILFGEAGSEELKAAEDALDTAMTAYQEALINSTTGKYSDAKRTIEDARTALNEAKAERDANIVTQEQLAASQEALTKAKNNAAVTEAAYNTAETNFQALGGLNNGTTGDYSLVTAAENKLYTAKSDLEAKNLLYSGDYGKFKEIAKGVYPNTKDVAVAMRALAEQYSAMGKDTNEYKLYTAYKEITDAQNNVNSCEQEVNQALNNYNNSLSGNNVAEYNRLKKIRDDALSVYNTAKALQETAQNEYDALKERKTVYDAAVANVKTNEKALQDALFSYEKNAALDNLHLGSQKEQIADLQEALDKLRSGGEGATVTSQVNGTVTNVSVSAGNMTEPNTTLMVVEVPDLGYTVSFSVTNEQSKKVKAGDKGEVMYNYGGSEVVPTLVGIRPDPQDATNKKLLVFKLSGDVESGAQMSISIGERGANYDAIVPNTAIKKDSNGDFVLIVTAKKSALGNRYVATRMDVKVLASDDNNSAVSGGLTTSDFVITTASEPIEPGMLVRLPDNA